MLWSLISPTFTSYYSSNLKKMKNKIKEIIKASQQKLIRVQLDYKTFMTISRPESLKAWLQRYPDAKIMSS